MGERGFAVFETRIGACGIAWGVRGVIGVQLPERDARATAARLARRFPDAREQAPPPEINHAIAGIRALLAGAAPDRAVGAPNATSATDASASPEPSVRAPADLGDVVLDMAGVPDFYRRVYDVARTIPPGRTLTYGEVAARLGDPRLAREVGQALGRNPFAIVVPCHRVVAAGGGTGGFSARGGVGTKLRLLALESGREQGVLPLLAGT